LRIIELSEEGIKSWGIEEIRKFSHGQLSCPKYSIQLVSAEFLLTVITKKDFHEGKLELIPVEIFLATLKT